MKGTLLIFTPGKHRPTVKAFDRALTLEELKAAIGGGYLEVVPNFLTIEHEGELRRCVAFCDEDGKRNQDQLGFNPIATILWDAAMQRTAAYTCRPDYLVGPVAVVFGDQEFMEEL